MELAAITAVLTALAGIIKLVLNHTEKQQAGFEKFLGNHMSSMSKSVENNSKAIEANTRVIQDVAKRIKAEIDAQDERRGDDGAS